MRIGELIVNALKFIKGMPKIHGERSCGEFSLVFSITVIGVCVIVHYRAWTESTGHKFEDTWDEQRPLEMILGKGISLAG